MGYFVDNWGSWAARLELLQNGQIWENNDMVFQVESAGKSSYRVIMFSCKNAELHYVATVLYDTEAKLCHLLESMNMVPTSKILTIRRR